jgi:hypothetical protein
MKQGNKLAGSNPERGRVENDFYATHPDSIRALLKVEEIIYPALEPACGTGNISKLIDDPSLVSTDLVYRGYGVGGIDFLIHEYEDLEFETVITNPPFNLFTEFLNRALVIAKTKVILFGKLQALEGQKRASFIERTPLRTVYVFKKRQQPMRNGQESDETGRKLSSTMAFAWFVWEQKYKGKPQIEWI